MAVYRCYLHTDALGDAIPGSEVIQYRRQSCFETPTAAATTTPAQQTTTIPGIVANGSQTTCDHITELKMLFYGTYKLLI